MPNLTRFISRHGVTLEIRQFKSAEHSLYHILVAEADVVRHLARFDGHTPNIGILRLVYHLAGIDINDLEPDRFLTLPDAAWRTLEASKTFVPVKGFREDP